MGVVGVLVVSLLGAATPASASTPTCNYVMGIQLDSTGDIYETVPAYQYSNGSRTWRCQMGYGTGFYSTKTNQAVLQLQDTINLCYKSVIGGLWPLSVDGKYGNNTKTAVYRIQKSIGGISVDGTYGPQTAGAMKHWTWARTPYGEFYTCSRIPQ